MAYFNPNYDTQTQGLTTASPAPVPQTTSINSQNTAPTPPLALPSNVDIQAANQVPDLSAISADYQAPTQGDATNTSLGNQLISTTQQLGEKAGYQQQQDQAAGVTDIQKNLSDLQSQIVANVNEAKAIPLQIQNQFQGRGATAGGVAPIETAARRNNAITALSLQSSAYAMQGNLALAQQTADRAVQAKFAPIEAQLATLKQAYEINKDTLDRADAKKANLLQIQLAERTRILNNAKEDQKIVYGWAAEAAKNGAPALLISRAQQASDPVQALSILSQYMSDPNAKAMALLDQQFKREQISNAQQERALNYNKDKRETALNAAQIADLQAKAEKSLNETGAASTEAAQTRLTAVDLANNILNTDTNAVTGVPNPLTTFAPSNALVKNQINQFRSMLALENRAKLKGSGPISDYESKTLNQSSSALGQEGWLTASNLSDTDFKNEMKKARGILTVMNGGTVTVAIKDPKTNETQIVQANRAGINQAVQDGMVIIYQ